MTTHLIPLFIDLLHNVFSSKFILNVSSVLIWFNWSYKGSYVSCHFIF